MIKLQLMLTINFLVKLLKMEAASSVLSTLYNTKEATVLQTKALSFVVVSSHFVTKNDAMSGLLLSSVL